MQISNKERCDLGTCHICGKSTKLEIHRNCDKRTYSTDQLRKKPRKTRKSTEDFYAALNK